MSAANQWLNTVNSPLFQSIPKLPICNLYISHNTPCLPPKTFHNLCFQFLLGITVTPREIKDNAYAKLLWGQTRCIMGDMQTTNCCLCANLKHPTFSSWKYLKSQKAVWWTFVHLNKIVHSRKLTFTEMLTSGDLKSGDSLFLHCTSPQNISPKIMTWE